jgi:hypothetical protein
MGLRCTFYYVRIQRLSREIVTICDIRLGPDVVCNWPGQIRVICAATVEGAVIKHKAFAHANVWRDFRWIRARRWPSCSVVQLMGSCITRRTLPKAAHTRDVTRSSGWRGLPCP